MRALELLRNVTRHIDLLVSNRFTVLENVEATLYDCVTVDCDFAFFFRHIERNFHAALFKRFDGRHIHDFGLSYHAVLHKLEFQRKSVEICKHIFVRKLDFVAFALELDLLINFCDFIERGIGASVRSDDAVESKSAVVGLITPVAAIGVFHDAVLVYAFDSLVCKVPDIAAAKSVVVSEMFPVVLEIAEAVAHAVSVFALNKRLVFVHSRREKMSERRPQCHGMDMATIVSDLFHLLFLCVHLAHNIGRFEICVRLIVNRTSIVKFESGFFHCRERFAVSAFVAERPEKNTSMVAIRQNHVAHTPAHLLRPSSVRTRHASCKSVSFEVVFAHNHNAVLVAKLVEMAAVGIVRSSYAVDVVFFEKKDILFGVLSGHRMAEIGMKLVAVYASYFEFFAVESYVGLLAVYRRNYLDFSEAEIYLANIVDDGLSLFN